MISIALQRITYDVLQPQNLKLILGPMPEARREMGWPTTDGLHDAQTLFAQDHQQADATIH
jgi:hypothetical protein